MNKNEILKIVKGCFIPQTADNIITTALEGDEEFVNGWNAGVQETLETLKVKLNKLMK